MHWCACIRAPQHFYLTRPEQLRTTEIIVIYGVIIKYNTIRESRFRLIRFNSIYFVFHYKLPLNIEISRIYYTLYYGIVRVVIRDMDAYFKYNLFTLCTRCIYFIEKIFFFFFFRDRIRLYNDNYH